MLSLESCARGSVSIPTSFSQRKNEEKMSYKQSTGLWFQEELQKKRLQQHEIVGNGACGAEENRPRKSPEHQKKAQVAEEALLPPASNLKSRNDLVTSVKIVALLKDCANNTDLLKGSQIHRDIAGTGLIETNVFVGSALISMYAKCGALEQARDVFDKLLFRNEVSCNALISGYIQHGHHKEALSCFEEMQHDGVSPSKVTFACVLKTCGSIGNLEKGRQVHDQMVRDCVMEEHIVAANAVVDMYAKCGAMDEAQDVFNEIKDRDVVSWNALIAGFAQYGHGEEALCHYEQMRHEGLSPTAVTFVCTLKACGSIGALHQGEELHGLIKTEHLLEKDVVLGNALIGMYAKCGALEKAKEVFNEIHLPNTISWTTLIAGYVEHGCSEEALDCFDRMQRTGCMPDAVTFSCALKACGSVGASEKGEEIHAQIRKDDRLEKHSLVKSALVDMYVKCGELSKAQEAFNKMLVRNAISWNAIIAGYALLGKDETVLDSLEKMVAEGTEPTSVTFVIALGGCSHGGLLDWGQMYFEVLSKRFGMTPSLEHHTCMVDLFGRAGYFDKAVAIIEKMPLLPDLTMWLTLLDASRKGGNAEVGRWAFVNAKQVEKDASAYICMSNIYAAADRREYAREIDAMRLENAAT